MSRLDDQLKLALQPEEPPPDFADRVIARINDPPVAKTHWLQTLISLFQIPKIRWVAISLAVLLIAVGVHQYRRYQQMKLEGEIAKARVMLALQIASTKLNIARKKVQSNSEQEHLSELEKNQSVK